MITLGYNGFRLCSIFVFFTILILSYIANFDGSTDLMAAASTTNSQINTLRTLTDKVALQERNISSNQSEDIKAIENSVSEEVQLLKT